MGVSKVMAAHVSEQLFERKTLIYLVISVASNVTGDLFTNLIFAPEPK
ncbi:hypothetical protein [Cecembia sp.]|nr:hypothetical protein [Cecembia sp.]